MAVSLALPAHPLMRGRTTMNTRHEASNAPTLGEELAALNAIAENDPAEIGSESYIELADRAATAGDQDVEIRALLAAFDVLRSTGPVDEVAVAVLERASRLAGAPATQHGMANYNLAYAMSADDPDRAKQLLSDAASAFLSVDDLARAATSLLDEGELEGVTGNREAALGCFERARDLARRAGNPWQVARADDRLAASHWELGRLEVAEQHLRAALAVRDAAGDPDELAWARYRLAWCIACDVRTNDRANEALNLLDRARTAARESGNLHLVADCDQQASSVFEDRDDLERAVSLLRAAVAVYDALGADHEVAIARVNLADKLIQLGLPLDGQELLRTVIDTETAGSTARSGAGYRLARRLVTVGRPEDALRALDEVDHIVDHDNRLESTKYLLARAATYNALNMAQATEDAARQALDHLDGAHLPSLHAEALEFLAWCADRHGDTDRAEALLGQAVALLLADGEEERARNLARELVPPPPERGHAGDQELEAFTGQYL
jgi:tetratricopeptide (TPR) repeat protein